MPQIFNKTKNTLVASRAKMAQNFLARMVGLLNRSSLSPQEALIIPHCQSIHMFFMRFPIDVIFVDSENKVVHLLKNIRPFQLSPIIFSSFYAIEMAVGGIETSRTAVGDFLLLE